MSSRGISAITIGSSGSHPRTRELALGDALLVDRNGWNGITIHSGVSQMSCATVLYGASQSSRDSTAPSGCTQCIVT